MNVRFLCPKKNELIITDIPGTREMLQENWSKVISCRCPHCGGFHTFSVREAYIDSVLHATEQDQRALNDPLGRFARLETPRLQSTARVVQGRIVGSRS